MNFIDTLKSAMLVLATKEVPLIVGESGIGKTALARKLAALNNWSLVVIDGNLLKEGEIGGLPIVDKYEKINSKGERIEEKVTTYAVHTKLKEIDNEISKGKGVLLFIDEINRCEHSVQQELMNLILNKEINGYKLDDTVNILAAMNPSNKYGEEFDYDVVEMDAAQENRFVWLNMDVDYITWINWAIENGIEEKIIEFISTFPEYLFRINDNDVRATPRSYERVSKSYKIYKDNKDSIPRNVFLNVLRGNVGRVIAEELFNFIEKDYSKLISFNEIFNGDELELSVIETIKKENHSRLYLTAINILKILEDKISDEKVDKNKYINRLVEFLKEYPLDLMVGIMKDIKNSYKNVYEVAKENDAFVEMYFEAYKEIRG